MDLVHETFLKAEGGIKDFRADSDPYTWLYRIATNECLQFIRKNKRLERLDESVHSRFLTIEGIEKPVEARILFNELTRMFDNRTRQIAFLVYYEDLEQEEVAKLLGITRRSVVARLAKFRDKVLKQIRNDDSQQTRA